MSLQVRNGSVEAQVSSGSVAVAGKHHRPPQSASKRKHRERFVERVQQALDALPGPVDIELVTIYITDAPAGETSSNAVTVAVEASFSIDGQGWIAKLYAEKLRMIGEELLRVADATSKVSGCNLCSDRTSATEAEARPTLPGAVSGPVEKQQWQRATIVLAEGKLDKDCGISAERSEGKQWGQAAPIVFESPATSVPMVALEDARSPGDVPFFAVDDQHADALDELVQLRRRGITAVFDGRGYAVAEIDWPAGFEPRSLLDQPAAFPRIEPHSLGSESFDRPGQFMAREEAMAEAAEWNRKNRDDRLQWAVPVEVGQAFDERTFGLIELIGELGFLEHQVVSPVRVVKPTPAEVEQFAEPADDRAGKGGAA